MSIKVYECTALTGGGTNALDAVPWTDLNDGDLAFVTASSKSYVFRFAASSSASESVASHPYTVKPDDAGANNGRWLEYVPEVPKANVPDLETISGTPGSNVIPLGGAGGKLDPGWIQDGPGSGLDADTVDGEHASAFADASHNHVVSDITDLTISATAGSGVVPLGGVGGTLDNAWIPDGVDADYLNGIEVVAGSPSSGQILVYDGATNQWVNDDTSASVSSATESAEGIAELATEAETLAGTDTSRIVTPANVAAVVDDLGLGKNLIINGNFDIWQRGTSITEVYDAYTADRWNILNIAVFADMVVSANTDVPSNGKSKYSMDLSNSVANYPVSIGQPIEAYIARQLVGKPITISFWCKKVAGTSTSLRVNIYSADSEDDLSSITLQDYEDFTDISSSWTYYKYIIPAVPSNCSNGLYVRINTPGVQAAATQIRIAQVQLELGSHATEFEVRQPGYELALCRRYYQVFGEYSAFRMTNYGTNDIRFVIPIVPMRATPSVTIVGTPNTDIAVYKVDRSSTTGFTFSATSSRRKDHIDIQADKTSHGLTDGYLIILTTSGKITGDAEL